MVSGRLKQITAQTLKAKQELTKADKRYKQLRKAVIIQASSEIKSMTEDEYHKLIMSL